MTSLEDKFLAACWKGDSDAVKEYVEDHVDVNAVGLCRWKTTGLMIAIMKNHIDIATYLEPISDINLKRSDNLTALHYAVMSKKGSLVRIFIKDKRLLKTTLNCRSSVGKTPIMCAVCNGDLDIVRELYRMPGLDRETKDRKEKSLIQVAKERGYHAIADYMEMEEEISSEQLNLSEKFKNLEVGSKIEKRAGMKELKPSDEKKLEVSTNGSKTEKIGPGTETKNKPIQLKVTRVHRRKFL